MNRFCRFFHLVVMLWMSAGIALTAQDKGIPSFIASDTVNIVSEQSFQGSGLYGYMNGGADLYLEYEFVSLLVQEIEWKGIPIKAEIYEMRGVPHAYGIFSVHAGEKIKAGAYGYTSQNPWQFQAALGNIYLSVVNSKGTPEHAKASMQAGEWFVSMFGSTPYDLPEIPPAGKGFGPILHARGMLGMRSACAEINPFFRELEGYTLWLRVDRKTRDIVGRIEAPQGLMNYLQVKARVMDTPLGDVYFKEFTLLSKDTALFKCQYRDRSKDPKE